MMRLSTIGHLAATSPIVGIAAVYLFTWYGIVPFMNEHLQVGSPKWWVILGLESGLWSYVGFAPALIVLWIGILTLFAALNNRSGITLVEGIWTTFSAFGLAFLYMVLTF